MKTNLLSLPAHYQLQTLKVALADGTLLPVTVIGNGKPVMMLHAYGMDAREFLPFILPLTGKYAFYLPHLRGFGAAKDIELHQFDFVRQYADDINTVIEQICVTCHIESLPVAAIVH
jgi:pimeloyl-ACP methyl ester carboxylesterase